MNEEKKIKFIDLFGGIGGFHYGLEKASKERNKKSRSNSTDINRTLSAQRRNKSTFNCIWYCDIDKYACQTYNKNFKTHYKPTDIRTVKAENIPDFDLLCAGFPCQSFSIAGKRKGFKDTRGTLFFEICRIAQEKRPGMLFLENVKGLLSHDNGETYRVILESLDELGYNVEWQVLNSKNFGVPQNRERVFIIGHLRERCSKQVFPVGNSNQEFNGMEQTSGKGRSGLENEVASAIRNGNKWSDSMIASSLDSNYWKSGRAGRSMIMQLCGDRDDPSLSISDNAFSLNANPMSDRQQVVMEHKKITERTGKYGDGYSFDSFCLDSSCGRDLVIHPLIRRLTPVECERLQGFPDGWTNGVSDTQRYKQLGNAVTVNVIESIGCRLLDVM